MDKLSFQGSSDEVLQQLAQALFDRIGQLDKRVRDLERMEVEFNLRLITHRAIITKVALVEIANRIDLTQEDWEEALDDFAQNIRGLREKSSLDEERRQFDVVLNEIEEFQNRRDGPLPPVFEVILGGKSKG